MSKSSDVGKLSFTHKPSGKKGPLEKSRYAIGGSPKNRKKTRGGNISRTWTNKSLNKSRVLARSLHTNNRTLAKKLNAVLVELSNCEETAAALRDDNEQLRQGTRFKDEAIEDLNGMIGQIAQLLVSAGKRAQDALAWPHLETHGDTFTLETSERLEEVKEPSLSPPEPPSGTEEPQNPFQRRDRIPRTPVQGDDEAFPSGHPAPVLTHLQAKSSQPKQDSVSDLPCEPIFSATDDQSFSSVAVPDIDRLPTGSVSAAAAAVTASAVPNEATLPAVSSLIGGATAPPAKVKGTVKKRKERGTFSKAPDPPAPKPSDKEGNPALAVYDFSMSETMNQTNYSVPSLAHLRAQTESTSSGAAAVSKEQKDPEAVTKLPQQSEAIKTQSESSESVSRRVKKASSSEKVGGSEAGAKKRTHSKAVEVKEKGSKTSKEKAKGSKVTSEKPKCTETNEKIDSVEPTSKKTAHQPTPDVLPEKEEDCETAEKIKGSMAEEPDEPVEGANPVKKRVAGVGKKRTEDEDVIEAPKSKLTRKEKANELKEELYVDLEDAEDFQDFVQKRLSGTEVKKTERKLTKKPEMVQEEEQEEEEKENKMKVVEKLTKKRRKVEEEEEGEEKENEVKKKKKKLTKKTKKIEEEVIEEEEKVDERKKVEKKLLKKAKIEEKEEEEQREKENKVRVVKGLTKKTKMEEKEGEEQGGKENEMIVVEEKLTKKTKVEEEKEGTKENTKKKVEKKLRKKTKKVEEEVEEEEEGVKENEHVNAIGRAVRICGVPSNSEGMEKKKKFRRIISFDDSDDSLVFPDSARKNVREDFLMETPRPEATKTDEKGPLTNNEMLNTQTASCNRPRRTKAVSLKEPSSRGKLRRGDREWCRTNV